MSLCVAWFVLLAKCEVSSDWRGIKNAEHYGATLSLLMSYVNTLLCYLKSNRSYGPTDNSTVPSTAVLFLKGSVTGTDGTFLRKYRDRYRRYFQSTECPTLPVTHPRFGKRIGQNWWAAEVLGGLIGAPLRPANGFLRFSHKNTHFSTLFDDMNYS